MITRKESATGFALPAEEIRGWAPKTITDLTIRQHFASLAMQGLVSKYVLKEPCDQTTICKLAVELADALINELNKKECLQ